MHWHRPKKVQMSIDTITITTITEDIITIITEDTITIIITEDTITIIITEDTITTTIIVMLVDIELKKQWRKQPVNLLSNLLNMKIFTKAR
jgi:amino acid transporter